MTTVTVGPMRLVSSVGTVLLTCAFVPLPGMSAVATAQGGQAVGDDWSAVSETFEPENFRAAPYLGNGRIGAMIPPSGGGYQDYGVSVRTSFPLVQPRYTGTYLAGFYASQSVSWNNREVIAALPAWSGLTVDVAGRTYQADVDPAALTHYRQRLNYRDATATTEATWTPDAEHRLDLTYRTFVSRAQPNLAVQQLTVTPHFSGPLTVTDLIDGAAARRVTPTTATSDPNRGQTTVGVRADGTDSTAFLVSTVATPDELGGTALPTNGSTAGIRFDGTVAAGRSYTVTKYVGIASGADGADPRAIATEVSDSSAAQGFAAAHAEHAAAWDRLWQPDIEIPGRDDYRDWIRPALYSVLSSVRAGQRWSVQPAGLSSDDYGGLTYWDAETWVFPTLLALYPELARTVVDFRVAALPQAEANARAYGLTGALYPWNDGPTQQCASPAVCGLVQEHLGNEIALAQWQYYSATGDEQWLRDSGAPVITAIANYQAVRVGPKLPDGHYHYAPAAGADEYVSVSVDSALTNAGVIATMHTAMSAARLAGLPVNPRWADIAAHMAMPPDIVPGVPAEYLGYQGAKIKQADTVLISYPFSYAAPGYSPDATLAYYFDRTDPDGPNMSNSVGAILSAQYDPCRTQQFLDRSVQPYVRPPYRFQSEARGDRSGENTIGQPAWIFVTGAGGFLQGLLYGPTGLRWAETGPRLDPMLPSGFPEGMTVRDLAVGDSRLALHIRPEGTTVDVTSGGPVTVETPGGPATIRPGTPLTLSTRSACP
ncbi:haloacid dehalogenase [Nocardia sp. NBC_01730]|uniref:glycosyl hydrolase family 65 protein n=1 Tax=Nocardia sp. NBC_01730 TaxID=2975998 RepID=UPI002E10858C|nr:haloacid dehalogenase [Nocardia sp. NBC_01730]